MWQHLQSALQTLALLRSFLRLFALLLCVWILDASVSAPADSALYCCKCDSRLKGNDTRNARKRKDQRKRNSDRCLISNFAHLDIARNPFPVFLTVGGRNLASFVFFSFPCYIAGRCTFSAWYSIDWEDITWCYVLIGNSIDKHPNQLVFFPSFNICAIDRCIA